MNCLSLALIAAIALPAKVKPLNRAEETEAYLAAIVLVQVEMIRTGLTWESDRVQGFLARIGEATGERLATGSKRDRHRLPLWAYELLGYKLSQI